MAEYDPLFGGGYIKGAVPGHGKVPDNPPPPKPKPGEEPKEPATLDSIQELLGAIFIQVSRTYDAQMLLLDSKKRTYLESLHAAGRLDGDPPILEEDAWDENAETQNEIRTSN